MPLPRLKKGSIQLLLFFAVNCQAKLTVCLGQQLGHLQQVTFVQRRSVDPIARFVLVGTFGDDNRVRITFGALL